MCHDKRNGGKFHGNISRNGYGNAIIGRYGGYFEEDIRRFISRGLDAPAKFAPTLNVRKAMHSTEKASNGGKVRVCIIHGLNISHKEVTYLLQKSISHRTKVLHA